MALNVFGMTWETQGARSSTQTHIHGIEIEHTESIPIYYYDI